MKISIVMNISLTREALDQLIQELIRLRDWESDFIPPKSNEAIDYNIAMRTEKVILKNNDYKITFSKQINQQTKLTEDE